MSKKQKFLLEKGLCIDCGFPNIGGSRYRCPLCLEKAKQKASIKYGGRNK